ncbi:protein-tyrosine phosphatase-like protein [Delphinella strobiligena]|nr:protein-tyrosine phosphatase-like protein [Delphinella strobiligena]
MPTSISLPSPPFVDVTGIANFRDIGGYPTLDQSSSIRQKLVFRCADPSKIQPDGLAKLRQLRVKKVFDLRSLPEIKRQGPEWNNVEIDANQIERIWCPVFADADYGPERVAIRYAQYAKQSTQGFVQAYSEMLVKGVTAYRTILSHLAQENPEPCIVHCTAGKDRTGVLVALLYLLCNVPSPIVAEEYSLTDRGLAHLKPLFTERLLRNPALAGDEEGVKSMISSRPENMTSTIDMINRTYGGAEGYVLNVLGLDPDQVARLRRNLTVDAASPIHVAL